MRKIEDTPLSLVERTGMEGDSREVAPELLADEEEGEEARLKNCQSSLCVASDGTLPAHMTHSDLLAGGRG